MALIDQQAQKENSPTLLTILNEPSSDTRDFLPTPVTPASDFGQFQKDSIIYKGAFSTFSVIKPPITNNNGSSSSSSGSLRNFNMTTEPRPYPCPECNLTFSRPHNLKSHLTTHSSERPYQVRKKK